MLIRPPPRCARVIWPTSGPLGGSDPVRRPWYDGSFASKTVHEKGTWFDGEVRALRQDHDLRSQPQLLDEGDAAEVLPELAAGPGDGRKAPGSANPVRQVHQTPRTPLIPPTVDRPPGR